MLYGVSVGPGDPALMTIKAVSCIERCEVLAVPRTAGGNSIALDIASGSVDISKKHIEYLDLLMTRDREKLEKGYKMASELIAKHLDAGQDVALLNLGDASLYSSYSYFNGIFMEGGYKTETIPGVTSFCACAALAGRSLTDMNMPLHILPASMEGFESALELPGCKVIMKSGNNIKKVKQLLYEKGIAERAVLVTDCGLPTQRIFDNLDKAYDEGYFATILINT